MVSAPAPPVGATRDPLPRPRRGSAGFAMRRRASRIWASFDAAPQGRRVPGTVPVAIAAALVVIVTAAFTVSNGWALAYPDAQSHLTIARRIFDSLVPGFTQLGTVWLPLPTILLIPFSLSLPLWSSGWGAAMLGAICMAATASACYRIAARIGLGRAGRLTAPVLLLSNPSLVYQHTTALSEPVLIMFLTACTAGLASWATVKRPMSAGEIMVFCGLPATGAVLSRYEGWALIASGSLFIAIVALRRHRDLSGALRVRRAVKAVASFVLWPAIGVVWWLSYNFVVYGDPLEFMRGQYSASALQAPLLEAGLLSYKGFAGLSLWSYHWAVIGTAGAVTLVVAAVGLVVAAARFGVDDRAAVVWLLATGWAFSLLSLYLGQTQMNNMHTLPQVWLNNRYALVTLPWLAVLVGVLVDWLRDAARTAERRARPADPRGGWRASAAIASTWVVALLLAVQGAWMLSAPSANSAILAEGRQYLDEKAVNGADAAAAYLGEHYDGGLILMDESASTKSLLPQIGLPLREYLNRATGDLFVEALEDPAAHAEWLFYTVAPTPNYLSAAAAADRVYARLLEDPVAASAYRTVFAEGEYVIARRIA